MRKISQNKQVFGIALLLGGLVVGFLAVGVSEAQKIPLFNRDVVLLDCVEDANVFVVKNVSSTLDVDIIKVWIVPQLYKSYSPEVLCWGGELEA